MASHNLSQMSRRSRRQFLEATLLASAAVVMPKRLSAAAAEAAGASFGRVATTTRLSQHLAVYQGPINVGIVLDGSQALLIDCGDGSVIDALPALGVTSILQLVFTHHHRDQACGAYDMAERGARISVPQAEREYFANPGSYWNDDRHLWRVMREFRPHALMLAESLRVDESLVDGREMTFGTAKIRVLNTPGHTEGAVSYLVEVDGKRTVFCGDCIYDEGQIWDLYSLQKGISKGGRQCDDYHGFMGDRWRLVESLDRIKNVRPQVLVPSHGKLLRAPAKAIDALAHRLETCYENYVGINAMRRNYAELFADYAGRPGQMPMRPGIKPPDCLRHFGTTWMVVSRSGAAFVMDVGTPRIVTQIKKMLADGEIKRVEGLWVTHYHFDHTDGIPAFQRELDCPCITDHQLAEVLTNPTAWRLPCLAPEAIRVHRPMEDGQSWQWQEFKMTSYYYPGQTLYHAALLVERDDLRMFFVGDSQTWAGIDDYCTYNRNWLGRNVGYQYCLDLVERLRPTHMFHCHVDEAFTFTPEEIRFMQKNLDGREDLFGQLLPWEHANYGLDPSWVRCFPYRQQTKPGDLLRLEVVVTNHSATPQVTRCRLALPKAFGGRVTNWAHVEIPAKAEKGLPLEFQVPASATTGRYVVPIDVTHGPWQLPQFTAALVDI